MPSSLQVCAAELLDSVLLVMQAIRVEMRSRRTPDLTIPQFRALIFINRLPGGTLSELAENVGLTTPSMSKMIEGLVGKGLVRRESCAQDRRRVNLTLTASGRALLEQARGGSQQALAQRLSSLPVQERQSLVQAMRSLARVFSSEEAPPSAREAKRNVRPLKTVSPKRTGR
ncbi:MAG: MarR family transcriptional regulator [Desulfarculus sp.]|jgi:DNA-binding MarR family transcriptional regulator|nr:MAG: MarR family transcriptional regulator [Desulfarculus sp.]